MVTMLDRVNLVKSESDRLKEYLTGLPSAAWSQASACDLWQVRDVVGHLTWAADGFAESISRGVQGDASVRVPHDFPADANAASLSDYIARSAIAHREALGDRLLAAFITSNDRLNEVFEGLGPEDWDKPCSFLSRPVLRRPSYRAGSLSWPSTDGTFAPDSNPSRPCPMTASPR